jgi:hypothetical protein
MLSMKLFSLFKEVSPTRNRRLLFCLSLSASTILWAGCGSVGKTAAPSSIQSSTPSAPSFSLSGSLGQGSVGSKYQEVLSVTGGHEPYHFALGQGQLPPGLNLNAQTGSISGVPTQPGAFSFTISVKADVLRATVSHSYTLPVYPCLACDAVQISPPEPSVAPGGRVQFTAAVSNGGSAAVRWSASAGTITPAGLFTAPAGGSIQKISIIASSALLSSIQATTSVTITGGPFSITSANLPSAEESAPYSAFLTASGGVPPYTWSMVWGSLPAGLQLGASSGMLSGSPTQTGTFAFRVVGMDAASHTAQQSFSLISTSSTTCGPPAYCSRTDQEIAQLPSTPPSVGTLSGANTIVTDPQFSNQIVRITDANSNPEKRFKNRTYVTSGSGSADDNLWNIDSTLFVVQDTGENTFPFTFDPNSLQAARLYVSSFPETNGLMLTEGGIWSRVNSNILYTVGGTVISKYDFTDRTNPPAQQPVYDFKSSPNCLPAGFKQTWSTRGGVSGDDTVFAMAYSNTGDQGSGIYAVVYKVGSGCSVLNTLTGEVTGDWGTSGKIDVPDRWTIHNVKLSKDGNWLVVAPTDCLSYNCSKGPYFWQVGTVNVNSCGNGGSCSGHWTEGYSHWVNCDNSPMSNQVIRSFQQASSVRNLTYDFPAGITAPFDQHQSWNNADPADSLPFLSSTWSSTSPFPAPWYNEIIAVAADGSSKTWRFAHTFITARSQRFSTKYAIGSVSQDGRFFIFSSDWMGTLGSESGTSTCTVGTNCRGDVFVVQLN